MADPRTVYVGIEINHAVDLSKEIGKIYDEAFDFVVAPLVHPMNERQIYHPDESFLSNDLPLTRSDMTMSADDWRTMVIGKVSTWINPDSHSVNIRTNSAEVLKQEIAWANHLGITACVLPTPQEKSAMYSQALLSCIGKSQGVNFWIQIPMIPHEVERQCYLEMVKQKASNSASPAKPEKSTLSKSTSIPAIIEQNGSKSWETWNRFRLSCHHHRRIGVALELTEHMPPEADQDRWFSERLKAIFIPTKIFITNTKGAPTLPPSHVAFLNKAFFHNIQIVITGAPVHGNPPNRAIYQQYITHIFSKSPSLTKAQQYFSQYYDYLQDPLQPLMDNLESTTYETFERDPIKYAQYELAILKAMNDVSTKKPGISEQNPLVVMVVGAGRGPIVEASMRAQGKCNIPVKIYALDKNPQALVTLKSKKLTEESWKNVVVVHHDMRTWKAPELADILVSELLGSFGDNELSPECLQGAEWLIHPDHGVSIPQAYTSYVAPVSTALLWDELSNHPDPKIPYETSHVVKMHHHFQLEESKEAFTFTHPSPQPFDNNRFTSLDFSSPTSTLIHGFVGYFECKLYGDVHISINPQSETTDMVSWFPIYFPIRHPITTKKGDKITINLWRSSGKGKVWYEWSFSDPFQTPVYNFLGRSSSIGL